ncbi:pirin family protein [Mumia sp. zg.B21]|uniref:pirin family protein n=1 Tax=Mumia sp. zg.B21 TaxID=2855447 RepID=UPI001C6F43EE|nr:pirin family protein [Mumia sp. zg.B21]MBW9209908.1 pirin family protein [Mumia sp. zg.B21]
MSNTERDPQEITVPPSSDEAEMELLEPRLVPLGGPRAMTVRRTLPQRLRSLIGAWCFADHYGPDDVSESGGMAVPGHPHTGLQTVTWLFDGEVEHRDTVGSVTRIRPGEVNLMTSGRGIAHSEYSTADTTTLRGVQLWTALPAPDRFGDRAFEHFATLPVRLGAATVRTFVGDFAGASSPVTTFTPLVAAEIALPARAEVRFDLDPAYEHGVLVDLGPVDVDGTHVEPAALAYRPVGRTTLVLRTGETDGRVVLIGGVPLDEEIVMWWNFVGRDHDEIVRFRQAWTAQVDGSGDPDAYGPFPAAWDGAALPAPALPHVRLAPRKQPPR